MELSVVIPVHDEEENVVRLFPAIEAAVGPLGILYEVIFVDDASRDATWERLGALEPTSAELVLIRLRCNAGQTPAMACGFERSRGKVVVSMDGDLQNDPADIPAMLERIRADGGYDLVCGWRRDRQDKLWSRKVPSRIANWIIRRVTGVHVHDYGCSLKAYTRELVRGMRLYSDRHRFLPFISKRVGARIGEMVVRHHPRTFGTTKYGIGRTWKVLVDLLSLHVLVNFQRRMLAWFLFMAVPFFAAGSGLLIAAYYASATASPVLVGTGVLICTLGVSVACLGFLSDYIVRLDRTEFDRWLVHDAHAGAAQ